MKTEITLEYILNDNQLNAIKELKLNLLNNFDVYDMAIFGSVVRKENDEESDLDLLILLKNNVTHQIRNAISDIVFEINLKYETNISIIVFTLENWEKGITKISPLYKTIIKEGIFINDYI